MTLQLDDFAEFFALVNHGHQPFAWQERLVRHLVETGRWPERISAPTGSGKSAVIDAHVFACALSAEGVAPRLPRRLVTVVGRRALVDSQAERAWRIREVLDRAEGGIGLAVRTALESLVPDAPDPEGFLQLVQMRGALPSSSEWLNEPRACTIINATPDMWGSRLLLRGYGSSRQAWPREAGLLAYDAVMVLDEAHLNRQLLLTAQRVAAIASRSPLAASIPSLQVVETTATPAGENRGNQIGVVLEDLNSNEGLAARLVRPKPLTLHVSSNWPKSGAATPGWVGELAELTAAESQNAGDRPVGCLVNRVDTAVKVAAALSAMGLRVECWVGPMRRVDVLALQRDHPGLFDPSSSCDLDVLVATQTIEVGVDIDLARLVSELAPGASLAQRGGRVNRWGLRSSGPITVVVPDHAVTEDVRPYTAADLEASRQWLEDMTENVEGLSPWEIGLRPPPAQSLPRRLAKPPHVHDALRWADTSTPMLADETLSLWLRDSLDEELDPCGLVLRDPLPEDETETIALLQQTPPVPDETFPTSVTTLRAIVQQLLTHRGPDDSRIYLVAPDGVIPVADAGMVTPGCVVIVASGLPFVKHRVLVPQQQEVTEPVETFWGAAGTRVLVAGVAGDEELLRQLVGLDAEQAQSVVDRSSSEEQAWQVFLPADGLRTDEHLPWAVLVPQSQVNADEDARQIWTVSQRPVRLEQHAGAVAARARDHAEMVGLPHDLVDACERAGLLHDEGKRDSRFQRSLEAKGEVLAKSGMRSVQQARRARAQSGLPLGWRHEHLSAAHVSTQEPHGDLVTRLVGTSHGHGRGLVLDTTATLAEPGIEPRLRERLMELFDEGEWHSILDRTTDQFGVWGCAYLEAVLRAADCQVSKEGS